MSHLQPRVVESASDEATNFWIRLGIDSEMLDIIISVDLHWDGVTLWFNASALSGSDSIAQVTSIIFFLFRFADFSDTRWMQPGKSIHPVLASIEVGLLKVVRMARDDPKVTDYHLHGVDKLSVLAKKHLVIRGMQTFLAESVMQELLEEERLLRIIDSVENTLREEHDFLIATSSATWFRLAALIGDLSYTSLDLAADVLRSSHVFRAYLEKRILRYCRQFPWRLARGDIRSNLEELSRSNPEGLDRGCGLKIKRLIERGFPMKMLVLAVSLFLDLVWGTRATENGHGSCAVIHRAHPFLSAFQLSVQSMLHQCRALFANPKALLPLVSLERQVERHNEKRVRLDARKCYLQDLYAEVRSQLPPAARMTSALRQHVFRNHSAMFAALPPSSQARYVSVADERAKEQENKHAEEAQHILAKLTIARDRAGCEERLRDKTNAVADHRIQPVEMEELLQLFNSKRCNREQVHTYLDNAVSPPAAAPRHVMDLFTGFVGGGRCSCAKMSVDWQKRLCEHRNPLRGTAFGRSLDEGETFYIFLFALQTPQEAWFIRAVRHTAAVRYIGREGPAWHRHRLVVDWAILSHDQLPFGDDDDLLVLSNLSFNAEGVACGGALEEALLQWKEQWPLPSRANASSVRAAKGALAPLLENIPGLLRIS
jgi:hypothetical protein